jgi:REP element-mobilizing transposase RayT
MQRDKIVVFVHLVWTTWDRLPLIALEQERALHDCLASIAQRHGCQIVAINGMPDHVHLLLTLPATVNLSYLVQQLKGVSSHFANDQLGFDGAFKWRGSYAAFSVSRWDVDKVATYIKNQKEHHSNATQIEQLEPE